MSDVNEAVKFRSGGRRPEGGYKCSASVDGGHHANEWRPPRQAIVDQQRWTGRVTDRAFVSMPGLLCKSLFAEKRQQHKNTAVQA